MNIEQDLRECGESITKVGSSIAKQKLGLQDYRNYYSAIIDVYNELLNVNSTFIDNKKEYDSAPLKKKIIRIEIKAWNIYIKFKNDVGQNSLRETILFYRHYFNKRSDYRLKLDEIKNLKKEAKDTLNILDNEEKLEKYRKIGQLFDEIGEEKIIKNPATFWVIVGVILTFIMLVKSFFA